MLCVLFNLFETLFFNCMFVCYQTCLLLNGNLLNLIKKFSFSFDHFYYFRFSFLKQKFAASNIDIVGYGSDADPRLLKAMKIFSGLGVSSGWSEYFSAKIKAGVICFQDLFHIISKIRTRLLETSSPMRIGAFKVSLGTLRVRNK